MCSDFTCFLLGVALLLYEDLLLPDGLAEAARAAALQRGRVLAGSLGTLALGVPGSLGEEGICRPMVDWHIW